MVVNRNDIRIVLFTGCVFSGSELRYFNLGEEDPSYPSEFGGIEVACVRFATSDAHVNGS